VKKILCPILPGKEKKKVAYEILSKNGEKICVFTAVDKRGSSTINAAGPIIKVISDQEGITADSLRFFDLQTHMGYDNRKPRQIDFYEVEFTVGKEEISIIRWVPGLCSLKIRQLFSAYIN
jgi:hypothetical protein